LKNFIAISSVFFAVTTLFSCKKESGAKPTVLGRWNLVSDSTYTQNSGASPVGTFYVGTQADYYNFLPDGRLSWREKSFGTDSAKYTIGAVSTVAINYFPNADPNYVIVAANYSITLLTAHKMVLTNGPLPTTGTSGYTGEIMTFSR
jgi:hypothetical protein